ncbi:serine/threonine protein kinase [Anabaena sphaerica FACHB-251]|uniref:non-specific serine/threonine protein kinase n=1 Tax=Anabaena sphaerica FACHB-251 TaxID=2692883 RepID=A0A927A022_9NOST|nr:serine/threonine-protein kinase [Anabaena sphaerica]MBD2293046.1 serine/threonine protein kinase [Anabaena sphaerica FACHB-251]
MSQQIVRQLLQGRYQIVQSLGAGVFGQTYVAEDTKDVDYPERPRYVVKQLKINNYQSNSYFDYLRLRFLTETETLKHLGKHDQIPELITCFEENEQFYLVQEYISGQPLSVELKKNQKRRSKWSTKEAMTFLEDALGILEFVHSQGFIHCDIKPENLIRRTSDGKLVLIDFGSIQPIDFSTDSELPISQIPVTSLGYIPPEQFLGQTQPNSDIYALGMIALQGLTGLAPLQLKIDPANNDIPWNCGDTEIDEYLAVFISQMIRYNYQERFQSASEALWVFKHITWKHRAAASVTATSPIAVKKTVEDKKTKLDPLLAGMRWGITINSLVVSLGVYSLATNSQTYSETATLSDAITEYQSGNLEKAISLAKSIPSYSNVYPEAQDTIAEWQKQWHADTENYLVAEQALDEGNLSDAMSAVPQIPYTSYWRSKREQLIEKTQTNIEAKTRTLLNQAYASAEHKDFSAALEYLRQIPSESSAGAIVKQKLAEYNQKRQIRAEYFLHSAYRKALINDFASAIKFIEKIPEDTDVYPQAKIKIKEYQEKQQIREKLQEMVTLKRVSFVKQPTRFSQIDSDTKTAYFLSPDYPQEANILT